MNLKNCDIAYTIRSSIQAKPTFNFEPSYENPFLQRDEHKEKMMEDSEAAALFVKHHVLRGVLCCAGIPRQMPFFDLSRRRTMAGDLVSVQRSHGGYIYADRLVLKEELSEN